MKLEIHGFDDVRLMVNGVDVPRWTSASGPLGLGESTTKMWFRLDQRCIFNGKRATLIKHTPMSRQRIQAALKRIPGTVRR